MDSVGARSVNANSGRGSITKRSSRWWLQKAGFFAYPTNPELAFITKVYSVAHFRQNMEQKKLLNGGFFADPFVVAKAWSLGGAVVTEERLRDNARQDPKPL